MANPVCHTEFMTIFHIIESSPVINPFSITITKSIYAASIQKGLLIIFKFTIFFNMINYCKIILIV